MKNETINGMDYVILENDDKLRVTTPNDTDAYILLKKSDDKISIEGDDSIIKSFNRLESKNGPAILKKDIIERCDSWLELYENIQKILTDITVESNSYDDMDSIRLITNIGVENIGDENAFVFESNIYWEDMILKKGARMIIPCKYFEVVQYLFAKIIYNFVDKHYSGGFELKDYIDANPDIIYSDSDNSEKVELDLTHIPSDYDELRDILIRVIGNFNIDIYPYQEFGNIINNMSDEYNNIDFVELMDKCFDYTKLQESLLIEEKGMGSK